MRELFIVVFMVLLITFGILLGNIGNRNDNEIIKDTIPPKIIFEEKERIIGKESKNLDELYTIEDESEIMDIKSNYAIIGDEVEVCVECYDIEENKAIACKKYKFYEPVWFEDTTMTLENRINEYLLEKEVDSSHIAYFYVNTVTQEDISYQQQKIFQAASTVKVSLVMAYQDLIDEGKVNPEDKLFFAEELYEPSYNDMIKDYPIGSLVPISVCMDRTIQFSDNSANHMLANNYFIFSGEYFRNYLANEYSKQELDASFYYENQISAQMQKNVLKKLYANSDKYSKIIENMSIAYPDSLIKSNGFDYDVYHKYGFYDIYLHDMAIVKTPEPILIGIFTENENNGQLIADISSIMIEYSLINQD